MSRVLVQDYFDIIKRPMDLQTIKRKLDTGQYQDPWEYVDDVWLMIDNARTYNKKSTRIYKFCQKVRLVLVSLWCHMPTMDVSDLDCRR